MNAKKIISVLLMLVLLCSGMVACSDTGDTNQTIPEKENTPSVDTTDSTQDDTQQKDPEPTVPVTLVDIGTTGGVVIIGNINYDEQGWYVQPIQPLNITFEYFLGNPSVFTEQTRIKMFDPQIDGVEKALYIGQIVTIAGTFRFYRDDFETLYLAPYTITIGKNAETSYSAPDLKSQTEPENLYDPSTPLPKYMDTMYYNGEFYYNAFMLSQEALELMGNDFADFYVGFVDAVLNYQTEFPCPDKRYAEMLSTIIYDEFPLYNAVAEPFEFFKHYDHEKAAVIIQYKYDRATYDEIVKKFFDAANEILTAAKPGQTEVEMAKNIYHALCLRMTYDHSALTEFERKESYYAYLYNSGVCVTFANVYNQLLTQVGIETTLAHCDNVDTYGHTWSIVTLDGKQYFCDPTYELSYDGGNGYRFFGMNYEDRTADGTGTMGIRYGRYYVQPLDIGIIAEESLN